MTAPIGLIAAMEEEAKWVRAQMISCESARRAEILLDHGICQSHPVVLACCGMGKVHAALTAQLLVDAYGVQAIIGLGAAGSLSPDIHLGDVVVGTEVLYHDVGFLTGQELHATGILTRPRAGNTAVIRSFTAGTALADVARGLRQDARRFTRLQGNGHGAPQIVAGTIATGDQMIADRAAREAIHRRTGAVAVDMEGAAIAHAAYANGVPFLLIRSISDEIEDAFTFDFSQFFPETDELLSPGSKTRAMTRAAGHIIHHPGDMVAMMRMRQNMLRAAANAALVLGEVLSRLPATV